MTVITSCVHAFSPGYTTMPCDSVFRTMPMTNEVVDSGGYHDPTTNNSRLTLGTGVWLVFGHAHWFDPGVTVFSRMLKNGVSLGYEYNTDGFAAEPAQISGPLCFWLDALTTNDFMEMQTANNRGGGATRSGRSQMVACKVSDWSAMITGLDSNSASPVPFPTTVYDPHGMKTSPTTLTAKKKGYYLVLSVSNANTQTYIVKNAETVALKGSFSEGQSSFDYVFDHFEVGDTVKMVSGGGQSTRQLAMIYMGRSTSIPDYAYHSVDLDNSKPYMNPTRFDSEWFDPGGGHPAGGPNVDPANGIDRNSGKFNMIAGYHLAIGKSSSDGGTFLQNESLQVAKNGTVMGLPYANNRHQRGSRTTIVAPACFSAVQNDYVGLVWGASGNYIEAFYSPASNFFVTDCAAFPHGEEIVSMYTRATPIPT